MPPFVAVLAASIYAYDLGFRHGARHAPPLIAADPSPTKAPPDSPGGIEIPHQDKLVYRRLATAREPAATVPETLLPPPEEPLPRPRSEPAPHPPSTAPTAGAAATPKTAVETEERTAAKTPAPTEGEPARRPRAPTRQPTGSSWRRSAHPTPRGRGGGGSSHATAA